MARRSKPRDSDNDSDDKYENTTDEESGRNQKEKSSKKNKQTPARTNMPPPANTPTSSQTIQDSELTLSELAKHCRALVFQLKSEPNFPSSLSNYTASLKTKLQVLEVRSHQADEALASKTSTIKELRSRIKHLSQEHTDIMEKMPTYKDFEIAVQDPILTRITTLEESINVQLQELKAHIDKPIEIQTDKSQSQETNDILPAISQVNLKPSTSASQPVTSSNLIFPEKRDKYHLQEDPEIRTLIVKHLKQKSGIDILKFLESLRTSSNYIEGSATKRFSVHLICKTRRQAEEFKRELQQNKNFNREYSITPMPVDTHKVILIGVHKDHDEEYIKKTFADNFNLQPTDLTFITSINSRYGNKNWIVALPLSLAKQITHIGGFKLGIQFIPVRPHTTVQKCTKCHLYTHTKKDCDALQICINCGEHHGIKDGERCNEPPRCMPCTAMNTALGSFYPIDHPSGSRGCEAYNFFYTQQRDKVNQLFAQELNSRPNLLEHHNNLSDYRPRRNQYDLSPDDSVSQYRPAYRQDSPPPPHHTYRQAPPPPSHPAYRQEPTPPSHPIYGQDPPPTSRPAYRQDPPPPTQQASAGYRDTLESDWRKQRPRGKYSRNTNNYPY